MPSRYQGPRVVAMVQDPGTLWVAWEGLPADGADDGWSLEVLGLGDEVLSSALVPYGARGAYMRVDVRFARRVRVGALRSAATSAGPVLPAAFDASPSPVPLEGEQGAAAPEVSAPLTVEGVVLPLRFATSDAPAGSVGSGSGSQAYSFEAGAGELPGSGSRPL